MDTSRRARAIDAFARRHVQEMAWARAAKRVTVSGVYTAVAMGYGVSILPCIAAIFLALYTPSIGTIMMGSFGSIVVLVPPVVLYVIIRRRMLREREILLGERCGACEYDLRGLDAEAACPECGAVRTMRDGVLVVSE